MKNNKYIKKISDYTMVGGLGALLVVGLVGCDDASSSKPSQGQSDACLVLDIIMVLVLLFL